LAGGRKTSTIVSQCIATAEPAYLAKHTFQLAQLFNTFYHRYPILSEADEGRRKFLLATVAVVRRELIRVLAAMGISVPRNVRPWLRPDSRALTTPALPVASLLVGIITG